MSGVPLIKYLWGISGNQLLLVVTTARHLIFGFRYYQQEKIMKNLIMSCSILAIAVTLSGCINRANWNHSTANEHQFNIDRSKCQALSVSQIPNRPPPPSTNITQNQSINVNSGNAALDVLKSLNNQNNANSRRNLDLVNHYQGIQGDRDAIFNSCMYEKGYFLERG